MSTVKKIGVYLFLFIFSAFLAMNCSQNPLHHYYWGDAGVYEYIGRMITEGYVPYRDVFDHKGPIVYLLHAFGYFIYPMYGVWWLKFVWLFASLCIASVLINKFLPPLKGCVVICLLFLFTPIFDTLDNTEAWALLPLILIVYFVVEYIYEKILSRQGCLVLGVCSGVLLFIKPIYLAAPSVLLLYLLVDVMVRKAYHHLKILLIYGSIGFLLPIGGCLCWLGYNDALISFWDDYVSFNFLYTAKFCTGKTFINTFSFFMKRYEIIVAFGCALVCWVYRRRYNEAEKEVLKLFFISFIFGFILMIVPKNIHPNYMFVLYPQILVLLVLALKNFVSVFSFWIVLGVYCCYGVNNFYAACENKHRVWSYLSSEYEENAQIINQVIGKDKSFASLYEPDMGCLLFLYTNRMSATLYPMVFVVRKIIPEKFEEEYTYKKPKWIVTKNIKQYHDYVNLSAYELVFHNNFMEIYKRLGEN